MSYGYANSCDESKLGCNDEDMNRAITGWIIMSVGAPVAIGIGMPMLLRSRKLSSCLGYPFSPRVDATFLRYLCSADQTSGAPCDSTLQLRVSSAGGEST